MEYQNQNTSSGFDVRSLLTPRFAVILLLVLAVITTLFVVLGRGSSDSPSREDRRDVESLAEEECSTDSCRVSVVIREAQSKNDVRLCSVLTGSGPGVVDCIKSYAYDSLDPSACELLKNQDREDCLDYTYMMLSLEENNIGYCESVSDARRREICAEGPLFSLVALDSCSDARSWEDECNSLVARRNVIAQSLIEPSCDQYREESSERFDIALCRLALESDFDNDALTTEEELEIGTDPQNPDSDGDGFDDGTEVENGFNPLGE